MDNFGITCTIVWLKEEPDSKERCPYYEYTDRYGRVWYVKKERK